MTLVYSTLCRAMALMLLLSVLGGAQESSPFASGLIAITEGRFFDLDSGGIFPTRTNSHGVECELTVSDRNVEALRAPRTDLGMDEMLPQMADTAWRRIKTSADRTAWFQVLSSGKICVLRYVVRMEGQSDPLPAPGDCIALGRGRHIELHFDGRSEYESYAIERRSPGESFTSLGETKQSPYRDVAVKRDTRYFYRVRGVTAQDESSLPTEVTASASSGSVTSGAVDIPYTENREAADLVRGTHVGDGGDIRLRALYGSNSAASFYDYLGREVFPCDPESPSPWVPRKERHARYQIPPATPFCVPLRGGGFAVCRWAPSPSSGITLHYESTLSSGRVNQGPAMKVTRVDDKIRIRVGKVEGFPSLSLSASYAPGHLRNVDLQDGEAVIDSIPNRFFTFTAIAFDEVGRQTSASTAALNTFEKKLISGTITFSEGEGFIFGHDQTVDTADSDIVLTDYRGDFNASVASVSGRQLEIATDRALFDGLVSCDPKELGMDSSARFALQSRNRRVFVIQTKRGGWAKVFVAGSARDARNRTGSMTIDYVFNPHAPVFSAADGDVSEDACTFNSAVLSAESENSK